MALLSWNNKYSVGVQAFDDQHKALISVLNELHAAMLKGQAQSVAGPLLERLQSYMREHFSAEEQMMSDAGFAGLAEHRAKHQELAGKVAEFAVRHRKSDNTMYLQLLTFVRDWITSHMQKEDQEYSACLKRLGASQGSSSVRS